MYESGENYLETILRLEKRIGVVRSVDVARELGYSKPSVSRGVGLLKNNGYLSVTEEGYLTFTEKGRKKAEDIYDRHRTLTAFLVSTAHVSLETAEEDACQIEHIISQETYEGIKAFMEL